MKRFSLGLRLLLGFLLVALLPLVGLAWFYLHTLEAAMTATTVQNIASIADRKVAQLEQSIQERLGDARTHAHQRHTREALTALARAFHDGGPEAASALARHYRAEFAVLGEHGRYHDILLIDARGNVVLSLRGEADLGSNLLHGAYRDSGLAIGFRQALTFLHIDLTRFAPYGPSDGAMSAFAVAPVLEDGRPLGALALQVRLDTLAPLLTERAGLGQSGQTVLVAQTDDRTWYPLRATPPATGLSGPARRALAGEHGHGLDRDGDGQAIVAGWRHLPALGWGMVVQIDLDEALAPLRTRRQTTLAVFALVLFFSSAAALLLGRRMVRNEHAIAQHEARYRAMFGRMNDGVALYRPDAAGDEFIVLDINPAGERIAGVRRADVVGQPSRIAFPGLEAAGIFDAFRRVHRSGCAETVALTDYHDARVNLWVENDVIRLPKGEILSVFKDITAQKQAQEALQLYARIFEHSGEAIMVTDRDNRIIAINEAFTRQTGYRIDEVRGRNPALLSSGHTPRETYQAMWASLSRAGYWQGELWDRNRMGDVYPKWAAISALRDERGQISHYIASFTDISERKAAEAQIEHLAHHDSLTGLFNRYNLEIRLSQAILLARREQGRLAVMFIDLDRFKLINDTLGHRTGDLLLIEVARRLRGCVRESDIVARQGGDEFVLVLTGLAVSADAWSVATKALISLSQPYDIEGNRLHTSPSIGISLFPNDGSDAETLLKNADTAMYHAKEQGRKNIQYFTTELNAIADRRLTLERELGQAIEAGHFELHYQPQIDTRHPDSPYPCAVEALVRWRHPGRGLIPPIQFIPIAEETGQIEAIGDWVLEEACRQMAAWQQAGIGPGRVAVNLSARQLRNATLVERVGELVTRFGLTSGRLELEVTESVAMSDPALAIERLQALRALGITLAIDDFGTGYSSLAYLKRLPIQILKLDREFVRDIETDPNDAAISAATLSLAHSLGLEVVAEGVENVAQRDFLIAHHCEKLQGYLYGRPEPAAVWEARWRGAAD